MNEPQIKLSDQELLDRLVDGELGQAARRELLLKLETQPDGWRRCALSFLEAQAWRESMRQRAATSAPVPTPPIAAAAQPAATPAVMADQPIPLAANTPDHAHAPASAPAQHGTRKRRHAAWQGWNSSWAMAASVLVAFGLGIAVQESWPTSGPAGMPIGGRDMQQQLALNHSAQRNSTQRNSVPAPSGRQRPGRQWAGGAPTRNVTLVVGGDGQQQLISVPVREYAGDAAAHDPTWWADMPAPLSHDEHQHLERAGQRVEQRRQLYPFQLEDGRSVMVPVDEVEIQPVSFD